MYHGFFDGSATPNPGVIGCGFCVYKDGKEVLCGAGPGGHGTNNEAEYMSLVWLLEECVTQGIANITCYGDSQLIIKQLNGEWSVGKDNLKELAKKAKALIKQLDSVKLIWIPRDKNARADMLSKRGAELQEKKLKISGDATERQSEVVNISERRGKSVVMPMMNNEFVILENNVPVYVDIAKMKCSCATYAKNNHCRHIAALKSVSAKMAV
jgi:ribonuclease HI